MIADNSLCINKSRIETKYQSNGPAPKPHLSLVQAYSLGHTRFSGSIPLRINIFKNQLDHPSTR